MLWRGVLVAALLVFALSVGGAWVAGSNHGPVAGDRASEPRRGSSDAQPGERAESLSQMVGMALNVYHASSMDRYYEAIDRMAAMGVNTLQVVTPAFQRHGASPEVRIITGPRRGPTPQQLIGLLRHAREKGLNTILMPQVNFTEPRGNEWRGKISPPDWNRWWRSYRDMLDHFLAIARLGEADVFVVGCELLTTLTQRHRDQWDAMIERCRRRFDGKLTFSTTWDTYNRVSFWEKLDFIGISAYWDLTTHAEDPDDPSEAAIAKRWEAIQQKLFAFSKAQDTPLLITELGYPSLPWALKDPWNYVNDGSVEPDLEAQARGYRAFLRNWHGYVTPPGQAPTQRPGGDGPPMAGAIFYEWDVYAAAPGEDTGMGIWGKPAYDVLHGWLRDGMSALRGDKAGQ